MSDRGPAALPLKCAAWLALLGTVMAEPAWPGEMAASQTLWAAKLAALPVQSQGDSASAGEWVTLDEAIALALDANRLVKNPERRQLIRQSVIGAYGAVQRAQRTLEVREETLTMCRELDRLMIRKADRGEAAPSVAGQARAARERATSDVLSARRELDAAIGQLNHLMGRDPQTRLFVTGESMRSPAAATLGRTVTGP